MGRYCVVRLCYLLRYGMSFASLQLLGDSRWAKKAALFSAAFLAQRSVDIDSLKLPSRE